MVYYKDFFYFTDLVEILMMTKIPIITLRRCPLSISLCKSTIDL